MNWFIWKKIVTYCNKFRPLNCVHYVKCSVNILLLIILVAAEGLWHLGSLFCHNTLINSKWSRNSLLCDNLRNRAPRTGLHHTLRTCRPWSISGREMNKHDSGVALISLASVGYDASRATQYLLPPHLVFQSN